MLSLPLLPLYLTYGEMWTRRQSTIESVIHQTNRILSVPSTGTIKSIPPISHRFDTSFTCLNMFGSVVACTGTDLLEYFVRLHSMPCVSGWRSILYQNRTNTRTFDGCPVFFFHWSCSHQDRHVYVHRCTRSAIQTNLLVHRGRSTTVSFYWLSHMLTRTV